MRNLKNNLMPFMAGMMTLAVLSSCQKNQGVRPDAPVLKATQKSTNYVPGSNLSAGLIAYWSCDNTAYDLSGHGHNGSLNNITVTTDRFGYPRGAYYFNGSSSYISVPDAAELRLGNTDFTLNAWVRLDAYNSSFGSSILVKRFSGINNGWVWTITGNSSSPVGVLSYGPGGGNANAFGNTVIGTGTWAMVTSIYNLASQSLSIYVNGVLDRTVTGILPANASVTAALYIGRDDPSTGTSYFFQGALDEIRMYNRAINSTELQQLYTATSVPTPSSGLVAYWPLIQTASDLSGQGHNGTASGVTAGTDRFNNPLGASQFNGSTSFISVPAHADLTLSGTDFTINAWVRLDSYNSSFGSVILGDRVTGSGYAVSVSGLAGGSPGISSFGSGGGGANALSSTAIGLGSWHMITSRYTASTGSLALYIDGISNSVTVNPALSPTSVLNTFYIGKDNPGSGSPGYFLNGALNDIRIYKNALNNTDIQNLYNALN
jgi:hypothetical protein